MNLSRPTSNNITTHLTAAMTAAATTATIEDSLNIPNEDGILQIDYDSVSGVGVDGGPETIYYDYYASATGNLTGIERAKGGTTAVAHAVSANVQAALSVEHLNTFDRLDGDRVSASHTIIGDNDTRVSRFVTVTPLVLLGGSINPADTSWHDVSLSAYTSTRAFAASITIGTTGATAGRVIYLRPNGSTATGTPTNATYVQSTTQYTWNTWLVGLDSSQIFEYAANNADVGTTYFILNGYWEYID